MRVINSKILFHEITVFIRYSTRTQLRLVMVAWEILSRQYHHIVNLSSPFTPIASIYVQKQQNMVELPCWSLQNQCLTQKVTYEATVVNNSDDE